jgi:hypothetical protein
MRWKDRKKGFVFSLLRRLLPAKKQQVPEIRIGTDRVWFNNEHRPFQSRNRQLLEISIREAGPINILEISYEQGNNIRGINVPIPKGKLKEAFEVQERLSMM